jgi:hypothetical protein
MLKTLKLLIASSLCMGAVQAQTTSFENDQYKVEFFATKIVNGEPSAPYSLPENDDLTKGYLLRNNHDNSFDFQVNRCNKVNDSSGTYFYRTIFKKNLTDYSYSFGNNMNNPVANDTLINYVFGFSDSVATIKYRDSDMYKVKIWADTLPSSKNLKIYYDNIELASDNEKFILNLCNGYLDTRKFKSVLTTTEYKFGVPNGLYSLTNYDFSFTGLQQNHNNIYARSTVLEDSVKYFGNITSLYLEPTERFNCLSNNIEISTSIAAGTNYLQQSNVCLENAGSIILTSKDNNPVYWFRNNTLIGNFSNNLSIDSIGEYYYSTKDIVVNSCLANSNKINISKCYSFPIITFEDLVNYTEFDTNEKTIANVKISIPSLNKVYFTDEIGYAKISVPSNYNNFNIYIEKDGYNNATYPISVYGDSSNYYDPFTNKYVYAKNNQKLNLGLKKSLMKDVAVSLYTSTARPGFTITPNINIINLGSTPASGNVTLVYENPISKNPIDSASAGIKTKTYSFSVQVNSSYPIYDEFKVLTTAKLGEKVCLTAYVTCFGDQAINNDTIKYCNTVRGSFDPNDINVTPYGPSYEDKILDSTELDYTIRFQNTGTDTAFTIKVIDTLDFEIDPQSVKMIAASHPYKLTVKDSILTWTFSNILLADKTTNEKASHGYIQYRVTQKPNNAAGITIDNSATIYFDYNSGVYTGNSSLTVVDVLPATVTAANDGLNVQQAISVFPNPAKNILYLNNSTSNNLKIIDNSGRTAKDLILNGRIEVNIIDLKPGLYFYSIDGEAFTKLIIE